MNDAMELVVKIAADEGEAHPRAGDEPAGCLLTQYCPPHTDPVYQGVLEPLFRLAEEVPFGFVQILAAG